MGARSRQKEENVHSFSAFISFYDLLLSVTGKRRPNFAPPLTPSQIREMGHDIAFKKRLRLAERLMHGRSSTISPQFFKYYVLTAIMPKTSMDIVLTK